MGFRNRYAIAGLGLTALGRLPSATPVSLKSEAIRLAVADAGLRLADIDGIIVPKDIGADEGMDASADLPRRLGISPNFFWTVIAGGASAMSAIVAACGAIHAGLANYVVCVCGSTANTQATRLASIIPIGQPDSNAALGFFGPLADHALLAQRHMWQYGTTERQLGTVAVTQRANANRRPEAQMYGRPMTLDDYYASPFIVSPFRRADCALMTDGGAAVIVTTAERARDLPQPPVLIAGTGLALEAGMAAAKTNYTGYASAPAGAMALQQAGMSLDEIDFAELYEPFSIGVIVQLEDFGFCKKGEGGPFVETGAIALDGQLPVNTGGGQASWGYLQGYTPLVEAVLQLTDRAGGTQLSPDYRVCLVSGHGGIHPHRSMYYADGALILQRDR